MRYITNTNIIKLRNIGRRIGLNNLLAKLINKKGYEINFDDSFNGHLKVGDCVWDVAANIGYYTKLFAKRVGSEGIVHAYEPSKINFKILTNNCSKLTNIVCHPFGIGDKNTVLNFIQGTDELGATSHFAENKEIGEMIEIKTGDYLIDEGMTPPNAMKIDVEGFELEVLNGILKNIHNKFLRLIDIEVHFKLLKDRGMSIAPSKI
jgi:FkbM family methyltransferase